MAPILDANNSTILPPSFPGVDNSASGDPNDIGVILQNVAVALQYLKDHDTAKWIAIGIAGPSALWALRQLLKWGYTVVTHFFPGLQSELFEVIIMVKRNNAAAVPGIAAGPTNAAALAAAPPGVTTTNAPAAPAAPAPTSFQPPIKMVTLPPRSYNPHQRTYVINAGIYSATPVHSPITHTTQAVSNNSAGAAAGD